ncbi:MAG: Trk family potassium uptake protein [Clostridiales bacterium]|nr:Trk family potassium uptake protein [Clostridiales bacterium]
MKTIDNATSYKKRLSPILIIILGYLGAIIIGTLLIALPVANTSGNWLNLLDAFFMATSAVCITGLTVVNTTLSFTIFGQIVLLVLIQIGGLGIMGFSSAIFLAIRKKLTLSNKLAIQQAVGDMPSFKIAQYLRYMIVTTVIIEALGTMALAPAFYKAFGPIGIFKALFISVSAFCNAGFDVLSYQRGLGSLMDFADNVLVLLSVSFLIILGGIGFWVIMDVLTMRKINRLMTHTKIVITATIALILLGSIGYLIAEWNNPHTLGNMDMGQKFLNSFFMAVTPRSAGFYNVNINNLTVFSKFLTMLLMFVGSSPASTGGGIKTTTAVILLLAIIAGLKSKDRIILNKHAITSRMILKAVAVVSLFCLLVISATMALLVTESASLNAQGFALDNLFFEALSALTTVGFSFGVTPYLSAGGKIIIMLAMFLGRLGPLTIGLLFLKNIKKEDKLRYPETTIMIG